jgi:DNA polymerase III delta prime subunit
MSIDVSLKDHTRIKVLAAAEGLSLKEFVIECIHERIQPEKRQNAKTRKAMEDARKGKTLKAKDISDLYKQLGL